MILYDNLWNKDDIKIKITASETNENENYKDLQTKQNIWANRTAMFCQPDVTKLNANIKWLLVLRLKIAVLFHVILVISWPTKIETLQSANW